MWPLWPKLMDLTSASGMRWHVVWVPRLPGLAGANYPGLLKAAYLPVCLCKNDMRKIAREIMSMPPGGKNLK